MIPRHHSLSAGMTMADVHLDRKYAAVRTARCLLCKDTANMSRGGLPSVQGPTSLKIQLCVCSKSPLYVDFELNFVALRPRRTDFTVPQHYRHVRSLEVSASGGHATVPGSGSPQIVEPFRPRSGGEIWGKNAGKRWRNASLCGITCRPSICRPPTAVLFRPWVDWAYKALAHSSWDAVVRLYHGRSTLVPPSFADNSISAASSRWVSVER